MFNPWSLLQLLHAVAKFSQKTSCQKDRCGHEWVCIYFLIKEIMETVNIQNSIMEEEIDIETARFVKYSMLGISCRCRPQNSLLTLQSFAAYRKHDSEQEKCYACEERVCKVEHGCFTPLVFSTSGGMGDCTFQVFFCPPVIMFYSAL